MTGLDVLWLPILLSSVAVFLVSSLIHMILPWHKSDYPKMAEQDKVMDALHPLNIPPGDYMIPRPTDRNEMVSPEFKEKIKTGPILMMTVMPSGSLSMGKSLVFWFLYSVIVSIFAAYIAGQAFSTGADGMQIFRFVSITAFLGYSLSLWQMSIWYRRALSLSIKETVDGLIYACLTGLLFVWLWPR